MKRFALVAALLCVAFGVADTSAKPLSFLPFAFGTGWWCPQGEGGSYTHQGDLYFAYDFTGRWAAGTASPSDPTFGKPIYAPFEGTVEQVVEDVPDFVDNYGSTSRNNYGWGNIVLLRDENTGMCMRFCHFKQDSVAVEPGQYVRAGTLLGRIGMTGWSTNPHLHMHLQANCRDRESVDFDFVEGPVTDDSTWNSWKLSELIPRSSVLDEDGSKSLGHYFQDIAVISSGYWRPGDLTTGYVGSGYLAHEVTEGDSSAFTWNFSMRTPGYYVMFVKWTHHPNRDPRTRYTVLGSTFYLDQRTSTGMGWHYIGWAYLSDRESYTITVSGTTPGKYIVADAIDLILLQEGED